jgi:hypothetical protein
VYHRDGLIDCSPYLNTPLGPKSNGLVGLYAGNETTLSRDDNKYTGTSQSKACTYPTDSNPIAWAHLNHDGTGNIANNEGDDTKIIQSIKWLLPDGSATGTTPGVIDGRVLQVGDVITFYTDDNKVFDNLSFRLYNTKISGTALELELSVINSELFTLAVLKANNAFQEGDTGKRASTGIASVRRNGALVYTQADPRSNIVNNMVMYQPPLAFFQCDDPGVFFGDMQIQLTPNSNWKTAAIEASRDNTYYDNLLEHGKDYCFGIKSMRLYLARVKIPSLPSKNPQFSMPDMLIANKSLPTSGQSNIDFIVPPSTQKVVIWIQDTSAGSNPKLPLTRFKTRQDTGLNGKSLDALNQYGPWAHTYDERLHSIQCTFAGITKPMSNFQKASEGGGSSTVNQMLQRWMMTNQNNDNRQEPEKFHDWLSMGPYYLFDFSRDSSNLGTYLQVKINYDTQLPKAGLNTTAVSDSSVNLYVCAIYQRDIALTYGQFGNVIAAQTQMS